MHRSGFCNVLPVAGLLSRLKQGMGQVTQTGVQLCILLLFPLLWCCLVTQTSLLLTIHDSEVEEGCSPSSSRGVEVVVQDVFMDKEAKWNQDILKSKG